MRIARYVTSDLSLYNNRPVCVLRRIQNFVPMGVESYLVLWIFTDECCHPNRFRVELLFIESFEIGRLDFPNRDTLKSTHCFCLTFDMRSGLGFVANHFDVVPVRTNDESCLIVGVVVRAQTRRTIVFATRLQSRAIESFDLLAVLGRERQVKMRRLLLGLVQAQ